MSHAFSSAFSVALAFIGSAILAVTVPVVSLFSHTEPVHTAPPSPETPAITIATSSLPVATTTVVATATVVMQVPTKPTKSPSKPPKKVVPIVVATPPVPPAQSEPPPATTTPAATTTPEVRTVGATTLAIKTLPLLFGGTAHAGKTVPIAYLQITNIGTAGMILKGFRIQQNGSARPDALIGLSTVDDKGGSRGAVGGTEGSVLFQNGSALAPTDAYFAPGQMRLFTIKATLTSNITAYDIGTSLMIDLTGLDTEASVRDALPLRGTTWIISSE